MKRNKLNLASGILLIIVSAFCLLCSALCIEGLIEILTLRDSYITEEMYWEYVASILICAFMIALYLVQFIMYLIFGIKLIKKSKLANAFAQSKAILIVSLVLVSCGLLFDTTGTLSGLSIVTIILLILALSNGDKLDKQNEEELKKILEEDYTFDDKSGSVKSQNQTNNEKIAQRVVELKKLKDQGKINNQEFDLLMSTMLKNDFPFEDESNKENVVRFEKVDDNNQLQEISKEDLKQEKEKSARRTKEKDVSKIEKKEKVVKTTRTKSENKTPKKVDNKLQSEKLQTSKRIEELTKKLSKTHSKDDEK